MEHDSDPPMTRSRPIRRDVVAVFRKRSEKSRGRSLGDRIHTRVIYIPNLIGLFFFLFFSPYVKRKDDSCTLSSLSSKTIPSLFWSPSFSLYSSFPRSFSLSLFLILALSLSSRNPSRRNFILAASKQPLALLRPRIDKTMAMVQVPRRFPMPLEFYARSEESGIYLHRIAP